MSEVISYLQGRYDMCRLLLQSRRMYRSQREVIEEQAYWVKNQLEQRGVTFEEQGQFPAVATDD